VARPSLSVWEGLAARFFAILCGVKKHLRDYADIRHVRYLPLAFGVWARESLTCAFVDGAYFNTKERKPLMNTGKVLHIARETIKSFDDYDLERPILCLIQ
jgi:hypothetical protein